MLLYTVRIFILFFYLRLLFWLDGTHNARFNIFSAGLDGRNHRLLWSGVGVVMSFAIDYTSQSNAYFLPLFFHWSFVSAITS